MADEHTDIPAEASIEPISGSLQDLHVDEKRGRVTQHPYVSPQSAMGLTFTSLSASIPRPWSALTSGLELEPSGYDGRKSVTSPEYKFSGDAAGDSESDDDTLLGGDEDEVDDEQDEEDEENEENEDEEDEEDEEDSSDDDNAIVGMPEPILDDEGDVMKLSVGEQIANEKIDHGVYGRLIQCKQEDGWSPINDAAYEHESQTSSMFISTMSKDMWTLRADDVLAAMDQVVLDTIARPDGNINHLYHTSQHARTVLDRYEKRSEVQPSVYVRAVTTGPSTNYAPLDIDEAKVVAHQALHYASCEKQHFKDACAIDKRWDSTWSKELSKKGQRFFLSTPKKDIDKTRQHQLQTFGRVLLKTAKQCEAEGRTHVPVMHYVGYVMNGSNRKKQHERGGKSSSWLLQCIKAIMEATGVQPYVGHYFVTLITAEESAKVAEILLTRLARAYYYAGGFSVGVAGASTNSIRLAGLTEAQRDEKWEIGLQWIKDKTDYRLNQRNELAARKKLQHKNSEKAQQAKEDEIQSVVDELVAIENLLTSDDARAINNSGDDWKTMYPEAFALIENLRQYKDNKWDMVRNN